jgi:hypothetical protein
MAFTVSELQAKKAQILSYVSEGMSIESTFVITQTPVDMQETLAADEDFMALLESARATLEHTLVKKMFNIAEVNEGRGISTEIRFLLAKLFPEKWGAGKNEVSEGAGEPEIDPRDRGI